MSQREIIAYLIILIIVVGLTAAFMRVTRRRRAYQRTYRKYEADRRIHSARKAKWRRNR